MPICLDFTYTRTIINYYYFGLDDVAWDRILLIVLRSVPHFVQVILSSVVISHPGYSIIALAT